MCVDCVLASLRIVYADPGRGTPPRGGSITVGYQSKLEATHRSTQKSHVCFAREDRLAHIRIVLVSYGGKLTYLFIIPLRNCAGKGMR
jgi:hypothetical protein